MYVSTIFDMYVCIIFVAVIPDPRAARSSPNQVLKHGARAAAKQLNKPPRALPDVAWPAACSAALWAFSRRQNAPEGRYLEYILVST